MHGIATRGEKGADRTTIEARPNLEIISVYGVGFDAVDLDACRKHNVGVTNTPDVLARDTAYPGIASLQCQARDMIGAEAWVRRGDWERKGLYPLKRRGHGAETAVPGLGGSVSRLRAC